MSKSHYLLALILLTCCGSGCWAPFRTPAVPAPALPDCFRMPTRGVGPVLNYTNLTARPVRDYLLGPGDVLEVTVSELFEGAAYRPLRTEVMGSGQIVLPMAGPIFVGGMNLIEAQKAIHRAYSGYFQEPTINVSLAEKKSIDILVLGEVQEPGIKPLPKYQNDVGHALAAAGGLGELAADMIEVHRRTPAMEERLEFGFQHFEFEAYEDNPEDPKKILRIPLRGLPPGMIREEDIVLNPGDVVVIPSRRYDVFWVVGQLDESNLVRFTLGDRERELGAGLVLPRDRDIDVVTAVAMAGYIDPIDSPTTVTVHRVMPGGEPLLIRVDLIKARYDARETVLVQPGDIIYVNPDAHWWLRRTFDRVVPDLITIPYAEWMSRVFLGPRSGNE